MYVGVSAKRFLRATSVRNYCQKLFQGNGLNSAEGSVIIFAQVRHICTAYKLPWRAFSLGKHNRPAKVYFVVLTSLVLNVNTPRATAFIAPLKIPPSAARRD